MLCEIKDCVVKYIYSTSGVDQCFNVSFNPLTGNLENKQLGICRAVSYSLHPKFGFNLYNAYHAVLVEDNRAFLEFDTPTDCDQYSWLRVVSQLLDMHITSVINSYEIAEVLYAFFNELYEMLLDCIFCYSIGECESFTLTVVIDGNVSFSFIFPKDCSDEIKSFLSGVFAMMINAVITIKEDYKNAGCN